MLSAKWISWGDAAAYGYFIPSYEEASYLAQKTEVKDIMEAFRDFR